MLHFFSRYFVWKTKQKKTTKFYRKEIRYQYWHCNEWQSGLLKFCYNNLRSISIAAFSCSEESFNFYSAGVILIFLFALFLFFEGRPSLGPTLLYDALCKNSGYSASGSAEQPELVWIIACPFPIVVHGIYKTGTFIVWIKWDFFKSCMAFFIHTDIILCCKFYPRLDFFGRR